jgi:hypothetical protein
MTDFVLNHLNWLAIIVSGIAYWMLGALWFALLFGRTWSAEMGKIGIKIQPPSGGKLARMYLTQLLYNILTALGTAIVLSSLGVEVVSDALKVGLVLGVLIGGVTQLQTTLWEGRSLKLMVIDVLFPICGVLLCSVILTLWR